MTRFRAIAPLFAFAGLMGMTISGVVTWLQVGLAPGVLSLWGKAAVLSILVLLPSGALVVAGISALVGRLLKRRPLWMQRAVMALSMGLTMEAVASALSTLVNLGIQDFLVHWLHAYWRAAPLALLIGPLMAFVVRPWVDRRLARVTAPGQAVAS